MDLWSESLLESRTVRLQGELFIRKILVTTTVLGENNLECLLIAHHNVGSKTQAEIVSPEQIRPLGFECTFGWKVRAMRQKFFSYDISSCQTSTTRQVIHLIHAVEWNLPPKKQQQPNNPLSARLASAGANCAGVSGRDILTLPSRMPTISDPVITHQLVYLPSDNIVNQSVRGNFMFFQTYFVVRSPFRAKHHVVVQYMARWMKCPLPPPPLDPLPLPNPLPPCS